MQWLFNSETKETLSVFLFLIPWTGTTYQNVSISTIARYKIPRNWSQSNAGDSVIEINVSHFDIFPFKTK